MANIFTDRAGKKIGQKQWSDLQLNTNYRNVETTRVGNALVLTEWIGISPIWYRTRVVWLSSETEEVPFYTSHEKLAKAAHQSKVKHLIQKQPDYNSHSAKETCVLCGSPMSLRCGKHGEFFGCTAWPKCPCVVNTKGVLSKKTKEALDVLMKQKEIAEAEGDPLEDRLDHLELD